MNFDLDALMQNPMFTAGIGLLGSANQRNAPLLNAYQMLQQQALQKQKAAQQAQQANLQERQFGLQRTEANDNREYRRAQTDIARTNAKRLEEQAAAARLTEEREAAQQTFMQGLLARRFGQGGQAPTGVTAGQMPPQPATPQAPQAPQISGGFDFADSFVKKIEGGFVPNDAGKGPTNFGVNQSANPDVDVKNLTPESAAQVRNQRYWTAIGGDNLPAPVAAVAYDAAINQGQDYAKRLLEKTGGDPTLMLYQRRQDYKSLAKTNPMHAKNLAGWESRLDQLAQHIKQTPQQPIAQPAAQAADPAQPAYQDSFKVDPKGKISMDFSPTYEPAKIAQGERELAVKKAAEERQARESARNYGPGGFKDTEEARAAAKAQREADEKALEASNAKAKSAALTRGGLDQVGQTQSVIQGLLKDKNLPFVTGRGGLLPKSVVAAMNPEWANTVANMEQVSSSQIIDMLQTMRRNSPTGSAGFGQFQQFEKEMFQAAQGLDRVRTADEYRAKLMQLDKIMEGYKQSAAGVYKQTYGEDLPAATPAPNAPGAVMSFDEWKSKQKGRK